MLNQAIMMGRLCADPELRKTQSEISVCSIRIAVDRDYGKGEQKETDFFDVVAWRGTAEFICKYFTKGRMIVVVGRMQTREWKDKEILRRISKGRRMCGGGGAVRFPPPYRSARKCGRDDDRLKKTKILLTKWEVQNGKPVYESAVQEHDLGNRRLFPGM